MRVSVCPSEHTITHKRLKMVDTGRGQPLEVIGFDPISDMDSGDHFVTFLNVTNIVGCCISCIFNKYNTGNFTLASVIQ